MKIVISKNMTVVGVNCHTLLDKDIFEKRSRKTKCGLCLNCTSDVDCGQCKVCLSSSKQICLRRSCNKPIEMFEMKKGDLRVRNFENVESSQCNNETISTDNVCDTDNEDECVIKNDILIDGPVTMFDAIDPELFGQDAELTVPMTDSCSQSSTSHSTSHSCILMHEDVLQL